jgi:hypothetical protein
MGVIPELTEETAGIAIDKIVMLAEPINGPNSFNLETAAYGYITRDERLIIPSAYRERMPESPTDVPDLNIVEVLVIAFYNFLRLKSAGKTEDTALFLALYRARLVKLGYLMRSKENRRVTVDEVDYHEQALDHHARLMASSTEYRTEFQAATNETRRIRSFIRRAPSSAFKKFVSLVLSKPDMFQHITMVATQYAASTYLVFRQHGHHWKEDLEGKYNIMWRQQPWQNRPLSLPMWIYIAWQFTLLGCISCMRSSLSFLKRVSWQRRTWTVQTWLPVARQS